MKKIIGAKNHVRRAMVVGCIFMGHALFTGPAEASLQMCEEPGCGGESRSVLQPMSGGGPPVEAEPGDPAPADEYISRWFHVGNPQTRVISWNTPLNPALSVGEEPEIQPEPLGPNPGTILATLSETEIASDFRGALILNVTGLMEGQSVLLERFKTPTDTAPITAPQTVPMSISRMKDGFVSESGEVANFNVLNDFNDTPGELSVQLNYLETSIIQIPGFYVYRVTSPTDAFDPVELRLTVTESPTTMKITGQVTHNGAPVPYALVGALDPVGVFFDFAYNDLIAGATADADGNYELYLPYPSEFDVVAAFPGYVGPYGTGVSHAIEEGQTLADVDLELETGTSTLSGTVVEAGTSGNPIPGLEMIFLSLDENLEIDFEGFALSWTDETGAFSVDLPEGNWGVMVRVNTAADLGYLPPRGLLAAYAHTDWPAESVDLFLETSDSLIWGFIHSMDELDGEGGPLGLEGVKMIAISQNGAYASWGVTDADGEYRIAVKPGTWLVRPLSQSLWTQFYAGTEEHEIFVPEPFSSFRNDFLVRRSAADLFGIVIEGEIPVGRLTLRAISQDPNFPEVERQVTHQDGYYTFGLSPGSWRIVPEAIQAAQLQLLLVNPPVGDIDPPDGGPYPKFEEDIEAVTPTSTIEITVTDPDDAPVPRVVIEATAEIEGDDYLAFGYTDENGLAVIPVIPGVWTLDFSDRVMRIKGFQPIEDLQETVLNSTPVELAIQLTPFANTQPTMTIALDEDGDLIMVAEGEVGQRYRVEITSDFINWVEQGRATAVNGLINIIQLDPGAITESMRAYRVRTGADPQ